MNTVTGISKVAATLADAQGWLLDQEGQVRIALVVKENNEDFSLWRFTAIDGESATVRIAPTMSSNDGAVVRDWALAGMGIAVRSEWNVAEDIAQGRLCAILPNWEAPAADVVALFGSRHGRSARTTAFLASLRQALQPVPWRSRIARGKANGKS